MKARLGFCWCLLTLLWKNMHTYYENSPSEKDNCLQIQIKFVSSTYFSAFAKISNSMFSCIAQVDLKECFSSWPLTGTHIYMCTHAQTHTRASAEKVHRAFQYVLGPTIQRWFLCKGIRTLIDFLWHMENEKYNKAC